MGARQAQDPSSSSPQGGFLKDRSPCRALLPPVPGPRGRGLAAAAAAVVTRGVVEATRVVAEDIRGVAEGIRGAGGADMTAGDTVGAAEEGVTRAEAGGSEFPGVKSGGDGAGVGMVCLPSLVFCLHRDFTFYFGGDFAAAGRIYLTVRTSRTRTTAGLGNTKLGMRCCSAAVARSHGSFGFLPCLPVVRSGETMKYGVL